MKRYLVFEFWQKLKGFNGCVAVMPAAGIDDQYRESIPLINPDWNAACHNGRSN